MIYWTTWFFDYNLFAGNASARVITWVVASVPAMVCASATKWAVATPTDERREKLQVTGHWRVIDAEWQSLRNLRRTITSVTDVAMQAQYHLCWPQMIEDMESEVY